MYAIRVLVQSIPSQFLITVQWFNQYRPNSNQYSINTVPIPINTVPIPINTIPIPINTVPIPDHSTNICTFTNSDEGPKCMEKGFNLKGNEIIC